MWLGVVKLYTSQLRSTTGRRNVHAREWKRKYGSVPEGWEEMRRKKGFSKCSTRLTTALDKLQDSDLEIEMRSISNVLSKIYKMSSAFVGAGMLYQATQAFVYEEMEARGNIRGSNLEGGLTGFQNVFKRTSNGAHGSRRCPAVMAYPC
jgi:hypothetical protein